MKINYEDDIGYIFMFLFVLLVVCFCLYMTIFVEPNIVGCWYNNDNHIRTTLQISNNTIDEYTNSKNSNSKETYIYNLRDHDSKIYTRNLSTNKQQEIPIEFVNNKIMYYKNMKFEKR